MLKGHTRIELTNVSTGEVEVHEHDNMVTNAIYKTLNNGWTQFMGGIAKVNEWNLPLADKALGGIALFESSIEANEATVHFPEGNNVTGYAGTIGSDGTSPKWGSRNSIESLPYDSETKSITHVWDFRTSEANGQISAVGLMDGRQADYYGQSAWNKQYDRMFNVTSYFEGFGANIVSFEGNTVTYIVHSTEQTEIKKAKLNFSSVGITDVLGEATEIESHTVTIPGADENDRIIWKDGADGYWYGFDDTADNGYKWGVSSNIMQWVDTKEYIQIIRINKNSYNVETRIIHLPSGMRTLISGANPIITERYIIFPVTTGLSWKDQSHNRVLNQVCMISKLDWTCRMQDLKDASGNSYSFYASTQNLNDDGLWFMCSNLKLPNGKYQMNDLILDDDGIVVEQIKPYMNGETNAPNNDNSNSAYRYVNLRPVSIYGADDCLRHRGMSLVLNKSKAVFLYVGYNGTFNNLEAYIFPSDCQRLNTINNLSSPIIKTASQSMKITYTITDVEDE